MQRDAKAYLWDIANAAESIRSFTDGKDLDAYINDEMLRAAVERKFGIVGEALSQLLRNFPDYRDKITLEEPCTKEILSADDKRRPPLLLPPERIDSGISPVFATGGSDHRSFFSA